MTINGHPGDVEPLTRPAAALAAVAAIAAASWASEQPTFDLTIVDAGMAGDCKMVGDIDGDDLVDAVVGGSIGEGLAWYRWPEWTRFTIASPSVEFTTDGEVGDVDGDGDLDVVIPDGPSGTNLVWFENPRPTGDPTTDTWTRRGIATLGTWGKDVELGDFDGDQRLDVATRTASTLRVHFQNQNGTWTTETIATGLSGEGMSSGDVDKDGDIDLVVPRSWIANPDVGGDARTQSWTSRTTAGSMYLTAKAVVADLDDDGVNEILYSNSEGLGDVIRCEPTTGDPTGSWSVSVIDPGLNRCHTLQVADMDLDGDDDVVLGQMHTSSEREIKVMYNDGGGADSWIEDIVDTTGVHNAVVADFGGEGAPDIFGCNWTGNPPVRFLAEFGRPAALRGRCDDPRSPAGRTGIRRTGRARQRRRRELLRQPVVRPGSRRGRDYAGGSDRTAGARNPRRPGDRRGHRVLHQSLVRGLLAATPHGVDGRQERPRRRATRERRAPGPMPDRTRRRSRERSRRSGRRSRRRAASCPVGGVTNQSCRQSRRTSSPIGPESFGSPPAGFQLVYVHASR